FSKGQSDNRYLQIANNLSEITLITGNKTFDSPINLSNNSPIKASGDNAIEFDAQGNVTFPGDVSILGSTFSADVQRFSTDDSIIKFADGNITDAVDIGFIGERASMNAGVIWDESRDEIAGVLTNDDPDLQTTITIDQYADIHGKDMLSAGDSYADNFSLVTDFNGTGWEGTHEGDFNVRNLVVRQSARFRELLIDQVSAIGGSTILSGARGKIESRSGNTVTLEDPNDTGVTQFSVGSLFVCRVIDVDGGEFKFVAGIVTAVNGMDVTLSNADADLPTIDQGKGWGSISSLDGGDVIVERGHVSNGNRQNVIYETATDSDAPVTKYL